MLSKILTIKMLSDARDVLTARKCLFKHDCKHFPISQTLSTHNLEFLFYSACPPEWQGRSRSMLLSNATERPAARNGSIPNGECVCVCKCLVQAHLPLIIAINRFRARQGYLGCKISKFPTTLQTDAPGSASEGEGCG